MATSTITELDLSTCHPNSLANRINAVPGLKSSTAFFTFLRANLVLPPSAMSSNVSTPYLEPTAGHFLGPPSPSPLATHVHLRSSSTPSVSSSSSASRPSTAAGWDQDIDSDIPPLSLDILTSRPDKIAALRLVADSVAQQRQQASMALVFHPLCLSLLACLLGLTYQLASGSGRDDPGTLLTLGAGAVMSYLLAIRWVAGPYIRLAELMGWSFLQSLEDGSTEEDLVLGSRYGGEMVGALVLRLEPPVSHTKRKGRGNGTNLRGGKGVIRAWTTRLRYRGKGLGGDLLREAVRITKERCGRDAEVGFAAEHANSTMVLPEMFNGGFRRSEMRAARALEAVLADFEGGRRKR